MSGNWEPDVWSSFSSALVADCLDRFQAMDAGVRGLSGGQLLGSAVPVRAMVGESSTLHVAVQQAPPRSVLVIDAEGHLGRAVWGEILTVAAQAAGLAGVVIDGVVRDIAAIRERGFPVFARGSCPAGPHKGWKGEIGRPVACAGVVVHEGDLVVGDDDGVVVVPSGRIGDVAAAARERMRTESEWLRRIESGEMSVDVLGLKAW